MKIADVRNKTVDELRDQLRELKRESLNLRHVPIRLGAVATTGIPVSALLAVTAHVRDAEVLQVVRPSQAARENVLNRRPFTCLCIEADWPVANQAAANPHVVLLGERRVGFSDAPHQVGM